MKCKLYLPYTDFNDSNFYADDNFYNGNGYQEALENNFNNEKVMEYDFSNRKERISYSTCECVPFNEQMGEETIDTLVTYAVSNDVTVMVLKFDFNTIEEEFETDLKMWIDNHNKINSTPKLTDEEKFQNEPKRTMKLSFKNLKGEDTFIELNDCKLLEPVDDDGYAILIERINFTSKV